MKSGTVRTSLDLPRDLHRQIREVAARRGCSARQLILGSIQRIIAESRSARPLRRLRLDPPLIHPAGRHLNLSNEDIYELIKFP